MGLHTTLPDIIDEVDVIIAGGGTAGCIVAARLAEADPNLSILVIEGGGNNDLPTIAFPAFLIANLAPTSTSNIFYKTDKEEQLDGRELIVPSGGILGGGSSTNLMMYTRAQRSDFDSWETPGWRADEILPYLKKLEAYHGPGSKELHGDAGPVQVSGGPFRSYRAEQDFIDAIRQVGWPEIDDLQNLDACNGAQRAVRYVSSDGKRQDAASRYLHPKLADVQYPNLHVLVENRVIRVIIENNKAIGVEFTPNPVFQPGSHPARTAKARKLVIVSGGACGTPPILERSGVGNPDILKRAGVPLVVDLPGVGHDYEDHQLLVYPYRSSLNPEETLDGAMRGRSPEDLIMSNDPILGWNAMDVTCKLRPSEADVALLGEDFQMIWNRDFKDNENRPLIMMAPVNAFPGGPTTAPVGQYFAVSTFSVYPYSRGHMHITGPNVDDHLDFKTGYFSDAEGFDIKTHVWAYKTQREIVRRMQTYRGEVTTAHPPFPQHSKAACIEIDAPLENVQNIEYSAEDDAILEKWLRQNVNTTWHSLGTCKMAPREKMGVVDARLGVHGIEALKVADLSIPPRNIAANTNNTAMAIGEKAADIFIEELNLLGSHDVK